MDRSVRSPELAPTHFTAFEALKEHLAGNQFVNRRRREASYYFQVTYTYHLFIRAPDSSFESHGGTDA